MGLARTPPRPQQDQPSSAAQPGSAAGPQPVGRMSSPLVPANAEQAAGEADLFDTIAPSPRPTQPSPPSPALQPAESGPSDSQIVAAEDIFSQRPKLARSPPRTQTVVEPFVEDHAGNEASPLKHAETDASPPEAGPEERSPDAATVVAEARGHQVLAQALLNGPRNVPSHSTRHSFPLAGSHAMMQQASKSPSNSTLTASQPGDGPASASTVMPRSHSLGSLSAAAEDGPRKLELSDAVSSIVQLKRRLFAAKSDGEAEQQKLLDCQRQLASVTEELEELKSAGGPVDDPDVWKMSTQDYASMVGSLSSIPGLQSTIARLRFRDRRRLVEASHQRWQRKWLVQLGDAQGDAGTSSSEAVRQERMELAKAKWREADLKGRLAEAEHSLTMQTLAKDAAEIKEVVLRDQLGALQDQVAQEREAWLAKEVRWQNEKDEAAADGQEADELRQEITRLEGRLKREADRRAKAEDNTKKPNDDAQKEVRKWEKRGERWAEEKAKLEAQVASLQKATAARPAVKEPQRPPAAAVAEPILSDSDDDSDSPPRAQTKTSTPVPSKISKKRKQAEAEFVPKGHREPAKVKERPPKAAPATQKPKVKRDALQGSEAEGDAPRKEKKRRMFGAGPKSTFDWGGNDDNMLGIPPELSPVKGLTSTLGGNGQTLGRSGSILGGLWGRKA